MYIQRTIEPMILKKYLAGPEYIALIGARQSGKPTLLDVHHPMIFTESNTVEQMILDALSSRNGGRGGVLAVREGHPGSGGLLGGESGRCCRQRQGETA